MATDLKLDSCGDLAIENGDFVWVTGRAEVLQRIIIYLKTWLTGYFYDQLKGVDYRKVFEKQTTHEQIKEVFRRVIEGIEGVDRVHDLVLSNYDPNTRNIEIEIHVFIDGTLEYTALSFNGQEASTCDLDQYLPKYLGDLVFWGEPGPVVGGYIYNLADWPGRFAGFNIVGSSLINLQKKAFDFDNPAGNEAKFLTLYGIPAIYDMANFSIAALVHIKEINDANEQGFFYTRGYVDSDNCSWQILFDGPTTLIIRHDINGVVYDRTFTVPAFENETFRLYITVDNILTARQIRVYINQTYSGFSTLQNVPDVTSGNARVGVAADYGGALTDSLNFQLGSFLMYKNALSHDEIDLLDAWFLQQWGLS